MPVADADAPVSPTKLRAAVGVAFLVSASFVAVAVTVAVIGGDDPEVAGSFVLLFLALLLLAGAAIGAVRLQHGDDPETADLAAARASMRRWFGALAVLGTLATAFLAALTPFPQVLAAVIPLSLVVMLSRGALSRRTE